MVEVRQNTEFRDWLRSLRDVTAVARINVRIRRLSLGNPGDVKAVGGGVSELRVDHGPGYQVYFVQRGQVLAIPSAPKIRTSHAPRAGPRRSE